MKDIFKKKDDRIVAKLVTLQSGGSAPLFSKTIVKANSLLKYKGIPVFAFDSFTISSDNEIGEISIVADIVNSKDISILKEITKAIENINLEKYAKAEFGFIIVYAMDEWMSDMGMSDSEPIEFKKITKFKLRSNTMKLEGLSKFALKHDPEKRSFVIDPEEEVE